MVSRVLHCWCTLLFVKQDARRQCFKSSRWLFSHSPARAIPKLGDDHDQRRLPQEQKRDDLFGLHHVYNTYMYIYIYIVPPQQKDEKAKHTLRPQDMYIYMYIHCGLVDG